jgi:polyhydroxyalkanoate synthase
VPAQRSNPRSVSTEPEVVVTEASDQPSETPEGGRLKLLSTSARQASAVLRTSAQLSRDLAKVAIGTDDVQVETNDRRFSDHLWRTNFAYRRLGQNYAAIDAALDRLVADWPATGADWRDVERLRFLADATSAMLAPTNTLLGNPAALRRALTTRGRSLLRGAAQFSHDLVRNGGMPTQTDRNAFTVGQDLAVSPGAVVARDDVAELIQYAPTTATVRQRPLLIVPPPIGRYYFLDLQPGRSFVEYAVSRGIQVFLLSWRNPGPDQRNWNLDTYTQRVLDALGTVTSICGTDDVNTIGFCAGGQLQSTTLSHLAGDQPKIANAAFAVTLLDFDIPAPIAAFSSPALLKIARANSRARGVLDGGTLGAVFSWMRPTELVTNYWVSGWLMGERPPTFDILAWNADSTNLPAALHDQFLTLWQGNSLTRPGHLTVLGKPVDLGRVEVPTFVMGALTDHLTPWKGCYQTTQLLSGPSTFVLSNSGHIAGLVNPPGGKKASYWTGGAPGPDAEAWREGAVENRGSWWEAWADWNIERAGDEVPAPDALGSSTWPVLTNAPGEYVLAPAG